MAAVRSSDTVPERRVRSALHRLGIRYRLAQEVSVAGRKVKPDLVFKSVRVAVFVDGCFWHGCPHHCRMPATNASYWAEKIRRNRERDVLVSAAFSAEGWDVIRVWEHSDPVLAARDIALAVRRRRSQTLA